MSPIQVTRNTLSKIDEKLPAEGWKAALTGFIGLLLPWIAKLIELVSGYVIPPEFIMDTQGVLTALVGLFLLMKANRPRQHDGRL